MLMSFPLANPNLSCVLQLLLMYLVCNSLLPVYRTRYQVPGIYLVYHIFTRVYSGRRLQYP